MKIGFACKYLHPDQTQKKKLLEDIQRPLNTRSTTVQWLNKQSRDVAEERLWDIMEHNIQSYYNLVQYVTTLEPELRMVRLGSDCLPVYTHPDWSYYWQKLDVIAYCQQHLIKVGNLARKHNVRLSFHPGQFTVLASDNPDIVNRSIEEFEYHADLIRYMGYGKNWQDFKCNVHISGRQGPAGIKAVLPRLSTEARNTLTIENDENSWGIDASLELEKEVALVVDIHHHWVHSAGEYITPSDDRIRRVIDSWRGVRPVCHYSISRENYIVDHPIDVKPDYNKLLESGYKKGKLRGHSDYYWNKPVNEWAWTFTKDFDIMCESKMKNLASIKFYNEFK